MSQLNHVVIQGFVAQDAEYHTSKSGKNFTRFTVVNNLYSKDSNGNRINHANFFPINLYGKLAEGVSQYLKKSQKIIIEGFLRMDKWETDDGTKRSANNIIPQKIHLIFDKKDSFEEDDTEIYETNQDEILYEEDLEEIV